jgi:hypothetical protein
LNKLVTPKVPKSFIHFKSKSEEERYMRIVNLIEQLENDTHDTFVKNLVSTHRAEALERSIPPALSLLKEELNQDEHVVTYEEDSQKR